MRIHIASDLHLEFIERRHPGYLGVEPCDADVLVLAGDISNGARVFDLFSNWPYPVIFVLGNHEFYDSSIPQVLAEFKERAGNYPNIKVLSPGTVELSGVRFIGCTLWTDYDVFGSHNRQIAMEKCEQAIHDHRVIVGQSGDRFNTQEARSLHLSQRAWLKQSVSQPFSGKTVVITHHAPHPNSIHPRFADDVTSAAFVSDLTDQLGIANLHIHGHTHDSFDYSIGKTRVIANPMGYSRGIKSASSPSELLRENALFEPRLVVEI